MKAYKMKVWIQLFVVAILSSLITVWVSKSYFYGNVILEETTGVVKQTGQKVEDPSHLYSDRIKNFAASSPTDFIEASKSTTPGVVYITSVQTLDYNFWVGERLGQSSGSGVIISPDGFIVTNDHVIKEAKEVMVMLNDNREYNASIIGTDPTTDLALLKIDATDLPFLSFGNSDSLMIGEWVLAVGNPLKLQSTVTAGIVSAKARDINILNNEQYSIESFIQTDAVVNPGNSGGALVNTNGDLVGINTAILTTSGLYEGYSFAVPSNLVQKVVRDIREFGSVQRGLLGIRINEVTADLARDLDLPSVSGIYINAVFPNSAAYDAGLESGDVIVAINDSETSNVPQLQEQIGQFRPGEDVQIKYIRKGKRLSSKVTLKNQINSTELLLVRKDGILKELGIEIRDLSEAELENSSSIGVKVVSIAKGSIIDRTNMIPDYIITHVNGKKVSNSDDLITRLKEAKGKVDISGFYEKYQGDFPYSFIKK
jgi:Do/DeqQ family serine protease